MVVTCCEWFWVSRVFLYRHVYLGFHGKEYWCTAQSSVTNARHRVVCITDARHRVVSVTNAWQRIVCVTNASSGNRKDLAVCLHITTGLKDNSSAQRKSLKTEHKASHKLFRWYLTTTRQKKYIYINVCLLITHVFVEKTGTDERVVFLKIVSSESALKWA